MRVPRFTIAGMMAAIAVVAFDCFAVMMTDLVGVVLIGVALNVGFIRLWRVRGPRRRFWAGFEAAGLAALLAYIACVRATSGEILVWPILVLDLLERIPIGAVRSALYHLEMWNQLVFMLVWHELALGLPMLLVAWAGGWLAARAGREPIEVPITEESALPRRRFTIARLMAVVAIVALDCGLVRLFLWTGEGLFGLMAIGLGTSLALIGVLVARGRLRRFSAGFVVTGMVAAVAYVAPVFLLPEMADRLYTGYLNGVLQRMPHAVTTPMMAAITAAEGANQPQLPLLVLLFIEATLGLPLLAVALLGGLLALAIRRRRRDARAAVAAGAVETSSLPA